MPTYDYRCKSGHTTESRQGMGITSIPCPVCGELAERQAIYKSQVVVTDTGMKEGRKTDSPFPEKRLDKKFKLFQEASAELDYQHKKTEEAAQRQVETPSLWKKALRRADAIKAGTAPPLSGTS